MKKGDLVKIRDSSYAQVIVGNSLTDGYDGEYSVRGKQYIIIECNCQFPSLDDLQHFAARTFNNTIVKSIDNEIILIEQRFLDPIKSIREVTIDEVCIQFGQEVKIKKE